MPAINVSVIIVSYNTKELTSQTIESVGFNSDQEIIVVDNASHDGSVEFLKQKFSAKIHLIARTNNGGFAIANNEGIRSAKGKYILLLNSDTIVRDGAIERMTEALDANPNYGVISCRLLNPDGSYQPQGGALPNLLNVSTWWLWPLPGQMPFIEAYQNSNPVDRADTQVRPYRIVKQGWIGGTAMLIRRDVIEKIGNLDEKIFMYAEDVDYCLRAQVAGFQVGITPSAEITHIGSASTGHGNALLGEVRGLLYLWTKHFPAWQWPILHLILIKGAVLRWFLFGILKGDGEAKKLYSQILKTAWKIS